MKTSGIYSAGNLFCDEKLSQSDMIESLVSGGLVIELFV